MLPSAPFTGGRSRALLVVSPNNPTGSVISRDELERLAAMCAARGVAIIADEVFIDYELEPGACAAAGRAIARDDVLSFTLGGLSKSVGLPQVKLGWIAVGGPAPLVSAAIARLELICDTYLAVSTPVQHAARRMLTAGAMVRDQIAERVRHNYESLRASVSAVPSCRVLRADAGWYAVMQVPALESEEDLVVHLLANDGVLVHPATFSTFRVNVSSSSVSCRRAPISRLASTACCGISLAAHPDRDPVRTSPRGDSVAVVCLSVARQLGHWRDRRHRADREVAVVGWPARAAVAAAERNGTRPPVAVHGDQRDGNRSDLHQRVRSARLPGARRRSGDVGCRSQRARGRARGAAHPA
jgi:hypothetical protein